VNSENPLVERNVLPFFTPREKPQDNFLSIARAKKLIAVSGSRKAGKTVVTAILGAALEKAGKRVAIVHFDHQTAKNSQRFLNQIYRIDTEYLLVDLGVGAAYGQLDIFNCADFGIVVLTPDTVSIENGYKFMELSVYRRLTQVFGGDPSLLDYFQQSFNMIANDNGSLLFPITAQIQELGSEYYLHWQKALKTHQLCIILNQIQSEKDCLEILALQMAAQHILNIDMRRIYYVHDDDLIRHCINQMNSELFSSIHGRGADDLFKIAQEMLDEKITSAGCDLYSEFDTIDLKRSRVCSVQCCYWGEKNCGFEKNGFACPMTLVYKN
jgi:MinD-like ATPase involved in chromosome partitioning or flagellar assembly